MAGHELSTPPIFDVEGKVAGYDENSDRTHTVAWRPKGFWTQIADVFSGGARTGQYKNAMTREQAAQEAASANDEGDPDYSYRAVEVKSYRP